MRIFISWSLPRSMAIAKILRAYLPKVIQLLDPFMSAKDIDGGQRWQQEIGERLHECHVGVCVVTSENVARPWLNFEAGAISKSMSLGRVIPFLFDVSESDLVGPLTQFQKRNADEEGLRGLLTDLNSLIPEKPLDADRLSHAIDLHLPLMMKEIRAVQENQALGQSAPARRRETTEVLEELVGLVRGLQSGPTVLPGDSDSISLRAVPVVVPLESAPTGETVDLRTGRRSTDK
jgi:hypothetical protein